MIEFCELFPLSLFLAFSFCGLVVSLSGLSCVGCCFSLWGVLTF